MSILTDTNIDSIIVSGQTNTQSKKKLEIIPFDDSCLTPVGYDLRIGNEYSISDKAMMISLEDRERFTVKRNETVFLRTLEKIIMPEDKNLSGLVVSKVSITAKGLVNSTTTIDPDWSGRLLIVLHNSSRNSIILQQGQPICTLVFLSNQSPSTRISGKDDGRNDLLLGHWNELTSKTNTVNSIKKIISPTLILVSFLVGNQLFGSSPGLVASVAVGVALSQIIR